MSSCASFRLTPPLLKAAGGVRDYETSVPQDPLRPILEYIPAHGWFFHTAVSWSLLGGLLLLGCDPTPDDHPQLQYLLTACPFALVNFINEAFDTQASDPDGTQPSASPTSDTLTPSQVKVRTPGQDPARDHPSHMQLKTCVPTLRPSRFGHDTTHEPVCDEPNKSPALVEPSLITRDPDTIQKFLHPSS